MIVDTLNITIMLIHSTKAIQLTQHSRKLKGLEPPDRMVIWASLDSSSDLPSSDDSQLTGKSTMTVDVFSDWKRRISICRKVPPKMPEDCPKFQSMLGCQFRGFAGDLRKHPSVSEYKSTRSPHSGFLWFERFELPEQSVQNSHFGLFFF